MDARLDILNNNVAMKAVKYLVSATKATADSLPTATQELVKIRAGQINGCGFCLDMHTKDAAQAGETSVRLNLAATWREATVFTEAERAALELTELGTRIADGGGVTDDAWANAAKHYDDDQLAAIVCQNRRHQRVQQSECHPPAARGRLRARAVWVAEGRPEIILGRPARAHAGHSAPRSHAPIAHRRTPEEPTNCRAGWLPLNKRRCHPRERCHRPLTAGRVNEVTPHAVRR